MRRARLLVFAIAIVAAGLAAMLANGFLGGTRTKTKLVEKEINTVEVLVARKEIGLGERLKAADIGWQAWPKIGRRREGLHHQATQPERREGLRRRDRPHLVPRQRAAQPGQGRQGR